MREYAIGIDVGGTQIRMGLFDSGMQLVSEQRYLTDKDATATELINFLAQQGRTLVEKAGMAPKDVRGVGAAFPASVDYRRGLCLESSNIACLNDQPVRDMLQQRLDLPVFVDNDANCFALGEKIFGEGKEFDHFVGATLGTGLGAGIIQNGRLLADANCGSGEFGEIPYMNGKLEDLCGSRFFTEVAGKSGYELSLEARSGNEEAKKMFDEYGRHLAYLVKIVVLTLDPQAVIFGGSIAKSFDLFKDAIFANLADFPYPKSIEKLTLLSSNKENSGILGAGALCLA
jgi:glucokinase